jgi:hypothetical protein
MTAERRDMRAIRMLRGEANVKHGLDGEAYERVRSLAH